MVRSMKDKPIFQQYDTDDFINQSLIQKLNFNYSIRLCKSCMELQNFNVKISKIK